MRVTKLNQIFATVTAATARLFVKSPAIPNGNSKIPQVVEVN